MFQWMKANGGCLTGTNTANAAIKSSKGMYYNLR